MTRPLTILGIFFFSVTAFSLESTNCSDAFGSVRRIELELTGKNTVYYTVGGIKAGDDSDLNSKLIGHKIVSVQKHLPADAVTTIFTSKISISRKNQKPVIFDERDPRKDIMTVEEMVICHHYKDSNPD